MAGTTRRFPAVSRNSHDKPHSAAVMIFGFLDDTDESSGSSCDSGDSYAATEDFLDMEEDVNPSNIEENKAFWESQDQLLKATLCRTSSIESKIRQATKEALSELNMAEISCVCRKPVTEGCRNCTQREVAERLRNAGYNCAICQSKWMSNKDIPSGEHTYIEVLDNSNFKKGEMRVVIELNLRGEFEMARASEEYNRLTNRLPEVFVGKIERLQAVIKLLCGASKRCMKERKMHIAPWRKQKYMQAKWLGVREPRIPPPMLPVVVERLGRKQPSSRQRASMLTFDLIENFPGLQCMAIKVV